MLVSGSVVAGICAILARAGVISAVVTSPGVELGVEGANHGIGLRVLVQRLAQRAGDGCHRQIVGGGSSKPKQNSSGFSLTPQFCSITCFKLPSEPHSARPQIAFSSKVAATKAIVLERGPNATNVTESVAYWAVAQRAAAATWLACKPRGRSPTGCHQQGEQEIAPCDLRFTEIEGIDGNHSVADAQQFGRLRRSTLPAIVRHQDRSACRLALDKFDQGHGPHVAHTQFPERGLHSTFLILTVLAGSDFVVLRAHDLAQLDTPRLLPRDRVRRFGGK